MDKSSNPILNVLSFLDKQLSLAILTRSNKNVKKFGCSLNNKGIECAIIQKSPVEYIQNTDRLIYLLIVKYLIVQGYSEYDFSKDIDLENTYKEVSFKELKKHLEELVQYDGKDRKTVVASLLKLFKMNINEDFYSKLEETLNNKLFHYGFNIDQYKNVVMTIHGAKGLEYDQVILFADEFDFDSHENRELHYVAATRAKSRLVIIGYNDYTSTNFWNYLIHRAKIEGIDLKKVVKVIQVN